ncbi:Vanadium/alternative nitrogenase delta subunit protein [Dioscorea alata]|uniref:Vanadium/alternative nitrogenase delta subunit protein n=1 Tax=Dioscorea alata TaxID=55571 RepID=A0ACB7VPY4_DIOAL|nr:Vanadium/alternative nitrogenase delta subunit protein [Dioscorea alata]
MKFCKRYEEYMQGTDENLPGVGLKKLKKMLKRCRTDFRAHEEHQGDDGVRDETRDLIPIARCQGHCQVCDGTFFPSLLKEMSVVVGCFNKRAQKLVELHLASGFQKYFKWFGNKSRRDHGMLMQQGKDLVTYAIINAIAMRKILKKYDKIHYSKQGQEFRSKAQSMHIEILQSPWLCELMAFYINLRASKKINNVALPGLFGDCSLKFNDEKPILSCGLFDSVKLDTDLTCAICLDTVFDPVSLTCGHIFCYMCCCSAASVTIIDGLKAANPKAKCPLCREAGVYEGSVHLDELNILLSRSCPEYWEERIQTERVERVLQAKKHWESQCRSFMGI